MFDVEVWTGFLLDLPDTILLDADDCVSVLMLVFSVLFFTTVVSELLSFMLESSSLSSSESSSDSEELDVGF